MDKVIGSLLAARAALDAVIERGDSQPQPQRAKPPLSANSGSTTP